MDCEKNDFEKEHKFGKEGVESINEEEGFFDGENGEDGEFKEILEEEDDEYYDEDEEHDENGSGA